MIWKLACFKVGDCFRHRHMRALPGGVVQEKEEIVMKIDWTKSELRDAVMIMAGEDECIVKLGSAGGGISIPQLT